MMDREKGETGMKNCVKWLGLVGIAFLLMACGGKKEAPAPAPVPVESTLTDPTCKDASIRLCLHRFPAPDVDRKNYDKCLTEEYAECLAK